MKTVRIISEEKGMRILRQSPGGNGVWGDCRFEKGDGPCDYAVVIPPLTKTSVVRCPPDQTLGVMGEPPYPTFDWYYAGFRGVHRVITPDMGKQGKRYLHAQPALPWHIDKDYDSLKRVAVPDKTKLLSFVTTDNKGFLPGHRKRNVFAVQVKALPEADVIATYEYQLRIAERTGLRTREAIRRAHEPRGYTCVEGKWEGLAPYCYSLAIENYSGPHYWTEKLADCFLAWAMPIYYGCTNLEEYFPPESFARVNILSPDAPEQVQEIIASDLWQKNRDAVAHARDLVLNKYQFFPFVTELIEKHASAGASRPSRTLRMRPTPPPRFPLRTRLRRSAGVAYRRARSLVLPGERS